MKIKLPKELVGTVFPKTFSIELNDIDIDIFLPSFYFKVLGEGKHRFKRLNDAQNIVGYLDALAQHPTLEGATTPEGRRVIERLVRTSLIKTGTVGRAKKGEQILAVSPYSILAAKPGFPTESRRQRGADTFIYFALKRKIDDRNILREVLRKFFGRGVKLAELPSIGGTYDGFTELDILSQLTIAFLDTFEGTRVGLKGDTDIPPACPQQEKALADDLVSYLFAYSERMPAQALVAYLKPLINLELFSYSLRLVHAINALVRDPSQMPAAMADGGEAAPPELYLDFTGHVGSLSHQMAADAVRRDIEAYQQFFAANLQLRHLDRYAEKLKGATRHKARAAQLLPPATSGPEYLRAILQLCDDPVLGPQIDSYAYDDYDKIIKANVGEDAEGQEDEEIQQIESMTAAATSDLEKLVILLDAGQRGKMLGKYLQWFSSVGGINRTDGILRGVQRNRRSWRYAPGNDLLAVLVQLAAVRLAPPNASGNEKVVAELSLRDFLQFLERRFGIIVDRPPQGMIGAEYHAAARENLRAMLVRLRQMGIFTDLSDDFTAQRLQPPYAKSRV